MMTKNGIASTAALTPQDQATLLQILADGGFMTAMQMGCACPPAPQDVGVTYTWTPTSGRPPVNNVTGCALTNQPLAGPERMAKAAYDVVSKY